MRGSRRHDHKDAQNCQSAPTRRSRADVFECAEMAVPLEVAEKELGTVYSVSGECAACLGRNGAIQGALESYVRS